jgi:ribosomal-protein-alanine N-acetyltransferase
MIREYNEMDINKINVLGRDLSSNYMFDKRSRCLVYEDKDMLVGFVSFHLLGDRAEIVDLFVHINYRRKLIGTSLLEEMIKICEENGCKSITLEVKTNNVAGVELYKKHNFKIISTRKNYYENGTLDAHLMYREL